MARRYVGDLTVEIMYHDSPRPSYRGKVIAPDGKKKVSWKFDDIYPPPSGFGEGVAYDSSEAYDLTAGVAVRFGSYYCSTNREGVSEESLEGYPSADVADAIEAASSSAMREDGSFIVRRKK